MYKPQDRPYRPPYPSHPHKPVDPRGRSIRVVERERCSGQIHRRVHQRGKPERSFRRSEEMYCRTPRTLSLRLRRSDTVPNPDLNRPVVRTVQDKSTSVLADSRVHPPPVCSLPHDPPDRGTPDRWVRRDWHATDSSLVLSPSSPGTSRLPCAFQGLSPDTTSSSFLSLSGDTALDLSSLLSICCSSPPSVPGLTGPVSGVSP